MATYIKTSPSATTAGTTLPTNAGTLIRSEEWGIDNLLDNCIVQSETITKEAVSDTTQDQKGAVVSQLDYDYHWTLSIDVIGDSATTNASVSEANVGDTTFTYAGAKWKCTGLTYTGTYNDKKKWNITGERWFNFPAQS